MKIAELFEMGFIVNAPSVQEHTKGSLIMSAYATKNLEGIRIEIELVFNAYSIEDEINIVDDNFGVCIDDKWHYFNMAIFGQHETIAKNIR